MLMPERIAQRIARLQEASDLQSVTFAAPGQISLPAHAFHGQSSTIPVNISRFLLSVIYSSRLTPKYLYSTLVKGGTLLF